MSTKSSTRLILIGLMAWAVAQALPAQTKPATAKVSAHAQQHVANASTAADYLSPDKILKFVQERFGVVSTTKLSLGAIEPSANPDYVQTIVNVDDGTKPRQQPISIAKNGHYLTLGHFLQLGNDVPGDIVRQLRTELKLPPTLTLTAGPLEPAPKFQGFVTCNVSATDGKTTQSQEFYVTADKKFVVPGTVFQYNVDLRRQALAVMSLKDAPTQGPAKAPVTIVEYADLECPSCARMHEFLENELIPKYGDKVRVVFKEFPLVKIHTWAQTAAIADECSYEINPSKFVPYRSLIFQHQTDVDAAQANPSQVRDMLLSYGQQVGLDNARLATCIDTQASKSRVETGMKEGEELSINSTPTFYINGKLSLNATPEMFTQAVEDALKEAK